MRKKILITTFTLLFGITFIVSVRSNEVTDNDKVTYENFEAKKTLPSDNTFYANDEDGNMEEIDIKELEEKTKQEAEEAKQARRRRAVPKAIINGVVNFKTKLSADFNTNYTEDGTDRAGYLNGYYAADGAYLGTNADKSKVKFIQAGVTGWVDASEVQVLDYDDQNVVKSVNYYAVSDGILYHYGTNDVKSSNYWMKNMIGYKPSYMNEKTPYYSYDGHYFYASYESMIVDYKNNNRNNSINSQEPYYNYYQYLSHRTKTNLTASMINNYINSMTEKKPNSKMKNMGDYFIQYQNEYGSNALLMFGVSANESDWGNSNIAQSKNNLFGHAAYDGSAGDSATGYHSPDKSIYSHAKYFVSEGYLDPLDVSGRYYGAHLGDKASGMNVKYASDPYWGEKAAEIAWLVQNANSGAQDANKYTIAIKEKGFSMNVRAGTGSSTSLLYNINKTGDFPFVILGEQNGETVSESPKWYKIQSDPTLNDNRTAITQDKGQYDYSKYHAYIHSSLVKIVSVGSGIESDSSSSNVYGDVNGDGKVSPTDYVLVRNHINEKKLLSGASLTYGDVNSDGKISPTDYVLIRKLIINN